MAQCNACKAEIAVHEHRCPACGADLRRGRVRSSSERQRARLCHLLALPGMLIFMLLYPAIGWFALVPLNLIVPLIYRWRHPESPTIRTHATEVLNFQVLWTATVAVLWVLVLVATPKYGDPYWSTAAYYMPDQPIVVEFPQTSSDTTAEQPAEVEEEEDEGSFWVLATMAFGMLSLTWLGGITLSAFLAYDLGNGGSGRYPLRVPLFRLE